MSRLAAALVFIALLGGAYLRFNNLGALQMSADEGATWAAADAPSIREVIALQRTHNPGKLPLHDLTLHGWIAIFGDSLAAMRALSALLGIVTIILMLPLTREIFRVRLHGDGPPVSPSDIDMIGALSALICAVSLVTIKYEREARMYGLLLALAIAHLWFFLRALRRQAFVDYVILALLTSALIAVNLVTISMLAVEGIWLFAILFSPRIDYPDRVKSVIKTELAIIAGIAILSPALYVLLTVGREAMEAGKVDWLVRPPWWEPLSFFNKATGSVAFPVVFALAVWGLWRAWLRARGALAFTLLVMWAPPLILVAGSFVWRPMFMERYAIYSFPAFFILIALGIWELSSNAARAVAVMAIVILAVGHIHSYSLKTHDVDWHEAARVAQASLRPDDTVAVAPPYAIEVVRYYFYPPLRGHVVGYNPPKTNSAVAILAEHGVNPAIDAQVRRDYPRVLRRAHGVVVLSRR
jgi:4-amino-4-deoxy-L-arabinose transferase-like glycosyltransferase